MSKTCTTLFYGGSFDDVDEKEGTLGTGERKEDKEEDSPTAAFLR